MIYSVSTEKPRQYRAKAISEGPVSQSISEILNKDIDKSSSQKNSNNTTTTQNTGPRLENKPSESIHPPTNVVVAFSNNDAGGKIVLTLTKCEKSTVFVAYTTAQDGKIDYGCWTYDELYIVINWDKNGLNNYTFDRFFDMSSGQRLKSNHLSEATKDISVKVSSSVNSSSALATTNLTGVKK
jgi:hypothetical protein